MKTRNEIQHALLTVATLAVVCFAVVACTTASTTEKERLRALNKARFYKYTDAQRTWPTIDAAAVRVLPGKGRISFYQSLPARPYEIIGVIQIAHRDSLVRQALAAAEAGGADAILVCPHEAFTAAGIQPPPELVIKGNNSDDVASLVGLLIRWKSDVAPVP